MKLRITAKSLAFYTICILFLIGSTHFLYLINLKSIFTATNVLLSFFSILIFILSLVVLDGKKYYNGRFSGVIFFFFLILVISSINSYYTFGYDLKDLGVYFLAYIPLALYYPFINVLRKKQYYNKFICLSEVFWGILAILFILQYFICLNGGQYFLKISNLVAHGYFMRIYGIFDGFLRAFILVIAHRIIYKGIRNSSFDVISFVLFLLSIILIDQSRYYLICVLLCVVIDYIYTNRKQIKFSRITGLVILSISVLLIIRSNVKSINTSISSDQNYSLARIGGAKYYFNIFLNNIFWGIGPVVTPNEGTTAWSLVRGPFGIFHVSDVGIVGTMAMFGVPIVIFVVCVFVKSLNLVKETTESQRGQNISLLTMMFVSWISISSYLDTSRVLTLLFTLVFMEVTSLAREDKDSVLLERE